MRIILILCFSQITERTNTLPFCVGRILNEANTEIQVTIQVYREAVPLRI